MRTRSFALLAVCALAGCSSEGASTTPSSTTQSSAVPAPKLAGEHIVTFESSIGEVRVTGRGGLTLGEGCVMDIVINVEDNRSESASKSESTYRVVRREGTHTYVSKDAGSWTMLSKGEVVLPPLALPLRISPHSLPGYGDFMCALGAIDETASVQGDGSLAWDLEAVQHLFEESQRARLDSILDVSGFREEEQQCYREYLEASLEDGRGESPLVKAAVGVRATLESDGGEIVYKEAATSGSGAVLRSGEIRFEPTRWSIPDVDDLPKDQSYLDEAVAGLKGMDTGC